MTQSKPVKKKKKTKTSKPKNEGKKVEPTPPLTPSDKRRIAEENIREMIKEAHKMHKNYARSLSGLSAQTSRATIGKQSDEGRYHAIEMTTSRRTNKGGIQESRSSMQMKMKKLSEEGPSRKCSTESGKKFDFGIGRLGSRDDRTPRQASAVFPSKRHADTAEPESLVEKARGSSRKSRESLLRIRDYRVGSFVSLELLDKTRCQESDTSVRRIRRKSILRQSTHNTRKSTEASDTHVKKSRAEKRKKDESVSEGQDSSPRADEVTKRKVRKGPPSKRGRTESESEPLKKEPRVISETKSMSSSLQSASSNPDSIISSMAAVGDFFSSNTSRSYFGSESDISKIDKKFVQILEAVTQTKINLEERQKQMVAQQTNDSDLPSTSETNKREPGELEQKLLYRINYLEQKLKSKDNLGDTVQMKKQAEDTQKDITPKTIQRLQDENDTSKPFAINKPLKDTSVSKVDTMPTKGEKPNTKEAEAELPKSIQKRTEPVTEVKPAKAPEDVKKRERPHTATKRNRREDGKQPNKEVPQEKAGGSPQADAGGEKNASKKVETWSIIKRLEKAFQTLGLNLEDLNNSDAEEYSSAKKKQCMKRESSGREKKVLPQSETLRRCQEAAQASASNIRTSPHMSGSTRFAVETNGSGDKNVECKRERNFMAEDLIRPPKEKKSKDNNQKEAYYASVKVTPRVNDLNELAGGNHVETIKSFRKRCGDYEKSAAEHGIIPKKSNPNAEESRSSKRYRKRSYLSNFDDAYINRGRSKREYSVSVSCSASSFSEEEGKKYRRRKKNLSLVRKSCSREEEAWSNKNGKGDDAMSQTLMTRGKKTDQEVQLDRKLNGETIKANGGEAIMKKRPKMEEENDNLEFKEIRHRHKQILTEIKQSLEEIKKQHNLWAKLRSQARQFNSDCHAKQKMLASYLRDVETNYERRNGDYSDVTSRDSLQKNKKMWREDSDWIMQIVGPGMDETMTDTCEMDEVVFGMIETDNETSTVSDVTTCTKPCVAEECCSRNTVCGKYTPLRDDEGTNKETPKWQGKEWEGGLTRPQNNFTQFLEKLNRIIVTEKSQLENLVLQASGSSSRSTQSNKTKPSLSAKSSSSSLQQHHKEATRPATTDNEITSNNFPGMGSPRHHKCKGNKKSGRDKSPDIEEDILMSRSRSFIRGDPGGRSFDSLLDSPIGICEYRKDSMSQCDCTHLKKQAEEHRYRKGDPSFRFQDNILLHHSMQCMAKNQEDDDAWKRKLELERILRVNEKVFKSATVDLDANDHDYDPYISARGRQGSNGRHRQQSMIIDHNRGEENEESQIVLGHASRHSGISFGLRKHDRQAPHEYLKTSRLIESSHPGRHHDKKGKKHHSINYYINAPESSSSRLRDVYCQTDNPDDYEDIGEMYLLEESGSSPSFN